MAVVGELLVLIGANGTPLTAALGKAEGELKGFSATGGGAFTAVRVAGAAMAAGVGLYLGEAAHAAIGFQDKLTDVGVTANLTAAETAAIGKAIQASAIGTTATGTEMLAALSPVAGELQRVAGGHLDAKDAVETLRAAEELAVSSNSDLKTSMKSITDVLLTYHLKASDAASVSTLLYSAHSQLGIGVDTLGAQLQKLQPRVAGTGVDLKTMLAIAREMEPTVGTGQRAVMTLGSVLQQFMAPTKAAASVLSDLHIKLTDTHGRFIGFGPAIDLLHSKLGNLTPVQRAADLHALFGKNVAIATALIRGGASGLDANKAALDKQGSAADAAATRSADLAHQGEIVRKSIETMTEAIGGGLLPVLSHMMSTILPVVSSMATWAQANPDLVLKILLVVGAVGALATGGLVLGGVLGGIATIIGVIASPIVLIIGAIAALAAHFGLLGDGAKGAVDGIIAKIRDLLPATGPLRDVFNGIAGGVSTLVAMLGPLISAVGQVVNAFGYIIEVVASGDDVMAGLYETVGNLGEKFSALLPVIGQTLGQLGSQLVGWIGPMIPPALAALGQFASSVFAWISRQVPGWVAQLQQWAGAFVAWIGPMIPPAIAALSALAGRIIAWIGQQLPGWVAQLQRWAGAFIAWIGPMIPPVLAALGAMLGRLLAWVGAQLPGFVAAIGKWAGAFIAWVGPMIPVALAALADLAGKLIAWVASVLPGFVAALQRMGLELVRWVIAKIPDLLAALVEFGAVIGRWILNTGAPALANVMVQMGRAFVQWVRDAGPGVVADLIAWWSQVAAWLGTLPEKLLTAGLELGRSLAKGIVDAIADVPNQVGQTLSKIPGVSLVGDAGNAVGGAVGGAGSVLGGIANALPHFAQGGVVPGYGPQLAVVHGGETVTPAGGRQTVINHTTVLQIGDEKIAQMFERLLYNTSSTYSSGFADSPVGVR